MSARLAPEELRRLLAELDPASRRALVIALARAVIEQESEQASWRRLRGSPK